ncbi:MAG TPA: carboxypeptidase-like regulatory domain-containing protein, partial [Chitinophagales bacterium]|nr:carboxypeptidase-like regulatory domain-containing protein [Chitinophagales bacterium]
MRKLYPVLFSLVLGLSVVHAQQVTQIVRGTITDQESNVPLEGVNVAILKDSTVLTGAVTDAQGNYRIENVPVGRVNLLASYIGYKKVYTPNILVNAGKETVLNFGMASAIETKQEVVVSGLKRGESINEMAILSVRTFTPEEAERYAGSRGDPARMAQNYAGVSGTDDSQNNLVVRGNSPFGVLYRVDNLVIPNPNHFAGEGQTGGSVEVLNDKMLSTSDFMTGAFPAEFGNATAAVFDIRLKNGNNDEHEYTAQLGVLGAELFGEGPLGKNTKASYIFNYRYATLEALVKMGINIGTTAIPKYQDFQFKLNFPLKNGDDISLFGLGGHSNINFLSSNQSKPDSNDIYASPNTDEYYRAGLGAMGITYTHQVNSHEYSKITLGVSTQYNQDSFNRVVRHVDPVSGNYIVDSLYHLEDYLFANTRWTLSFMRNNKLSPRSSIRYGIVNEMFQPQYYYRVLWEPQFVPWLTDYKWLTRLNTKGEFHLLIQPYAQWKYALKENVSTVIGLHTQFFTLSKSVSVEPRFSLKWQIKPNQSFSFGAGLFSQMLPVYQYFVQDTNGIEQNRHLDFIRSFEIILGYDIFFKHDILIKIEGYFQQLWNIPVDTFPSSYNVMDEGTGFNYFFPGKLVNKGLGRNMGLEFTMEKFFTHNWFIMFSSSVFDSKLTGSNGLWYNSDFNNHYILNLLGTKEFRWHSKNGKRINTVGIGGKITFGGGQRYTPYDTVLSKVNEDPVVVDSLRDKYEF